jgi:dipeptidyl aminopeptidase/acylaminoacyl peptidase
MTPATAGGCFRSARITLVLVLLRIFMAMAVTTCFAAAPAADAAPSVADIVEFTRIMAPSGSSEEQLRQQQVSPDGTRAFILTRKASARSDRNRYRLLLLDVRPERLTEGRYEEPEPLAMFEPVVDEIAGYPSVTDLRWVGNRMIAFRARLHDALRQVFQFDTQTRAMTQLTFSPTGVMAYATSDDLHTVLYAAQLPNPPLADGQRGIVVGNQSFWSVMFGQNELAMQSRVFQYFVVEAGGARRPRSLGRPIADLRTPSPFMSLSPDGRWAVLPHNEPERHARWIQDYPLVAETSRSVGGQSLIDPLRYFSRPNTYFPMRLMAYRVADGYQQPVVDAPDSGGVRGIPPLLWQDQGRSVVIAGTHLPLGEGGRQVSDTAAHIIEYWPESGRSQIIARATGRVTDTRALSPEAFAATDEAGPRTFRRRGDGSWEELDAGSAAPVTISGQGSVVPWKLRIRQDLDLPPDVVAEGPTGRLVPLTRLNPQVTPAWGTMRPYRWTDAHGRQWDGGLLLPEGFRRGVRHALVIQTYGFSPTRFYLDGTNETEVATSGFAGRAFLKENILVLAFPWRATTSAPRGDREETVAFADGVRAAIEALVAEGIVDRDRVGIMGWSRTGERVLNMITFTDVPIRAATLLDGDANTLFSTVLTYGFSDRITARKEQMNGGAPVGETIAAWTRNDPSMNTGCIRAALRIESYGPAVKNNWDIYALMRRQYKAVEMIVIPGGSHTLHTPGERMLSLQGNVDWYRFWLTGGQRTEVLLAGESDETLREQYRRWGQMAELKKVDDAKPGCARSADGF